MRQRISFPGMARSLSMAGTADGALEHIEGMRLENGAWVATSDNDSVVVSSHEFDDVFIHTIDSAKVFTAYNFQTGDLHYWIGNETPKTIFVGAEFDVTMKAMGAILVVITSVAGEQAKMKYFEYNITTAIYKNVTLDETEAVKFLFQNVTDINTLNNDMTMTNTGGVDNYASVKATVDQYFNDWQTDGKVNGWMFVSAAFVLYDGSYYRPSVPQLIYMGNGNQALSPDSAGIGTLDPADYTTVKITTTGVSHEYVKIENYRPGKLQVSVASHETISAMAAVGKIVGIAIFASPVVSRKWEYGAEKSRVTADMSKRSGIQRLLHREEYLSYEDVAKKVIKNSFFSGNADVSDWYKWIGLYKVGSLTIESISETWTDVPKCNYNTIEQQDQFPTDLARHTISAKTSFVYNNRLLLGHISTKLYGENLKTEDVLMFTPSGVTHEVFCIFKLKTSDEQLSIRTIPAAIELYNTGGPTYWLRLPNNPIVYPDSRAYAMDIILHNILTDTYLLADSFKLQPSETSNIAYYTRPLNVIETLKEVSTLSSVIPEPTYNPTITDTNRVQASETGNPYLFPARYSYNVGTTKVVAMAATTEPTSTGQFGQYPVIVFTGDGVWALELGGGEVFVQSIVPMTSDVAMDDNLVSNSAAVFFKTKHGIFALSGRQSTNLSIPLVASCDTSLDSNAQLNGVLAGMFYTVPAGTPIPVDRTSMLDYIALQGTRLAIDPKTNELLVYNRVKDFTYTFGLDSKAWYAKNRGYISILNDYSRILAIPTSNPSEIIEVDQTKTNTNAKSFRLETRPIFAGKGLTGISGLKVEVFTKGATANCLIVAVLATNGDASKWGMIAGKKVMLGSGGMVSEVLFGHIPGKWRAVKIVVAGVRMYSAEILGVEFDTNERMNQKLR